MRWELSEEQEMFTETLGGWLERFAAPANVRKWGESGDPAEFERRFVDEGWFSAGLPEEVGGQGGGLLELALTAEALARGEQLEDLEVSRPTLEDVYLELTADVEEPRHV